VGREFSSTETEVPATWFGILNSLFIVVLHLFLEVGKVSTTFPAIKVVWVLALGLGFFWLMGVLMWIQ
jgi:POT family proton-dependent oligopeptide transporter